VASGGARRLRARAKLRVSVGGVAGRALTRCAAEPFFNREGEVAELKSLLLDEPDDVTLLLGPRDCGKSVRAWGLGGVAACTAAARWPPIPSR
jgi:hypothetical protein